MSRLVQRRCRYQRARRFGHETATPESGIDGRGWELTFLGDLIKIGKDDAGKKEKKWLDLKRVFFFWDWDWDRLG